MIHSVQTLSQLTEILRSEGTLADVLHRVADQIAEALAAQCVAVVIIDPSSEVIEHWIQGGPDRERIPANVNFEALLQQAHLCVREGRFFFQHANLLSAPIRWLDQVVGLLVLSEASDGHVYIEEECHWLSAAATQCAWLLDHGRLLSELVLTQELAAESQRAKSNFLAVMSHELRTPLNAVIGFANLLIQSELTEAQRDYAESIATGGESLLAVINDILNLSRIEAGQLELQVGPFDPQDCVRATVALFRPEAERKGLVLRSDISGLAAGLYRGDEVRIRQILINLVGNAIKFTSSGEVAVIAMSEPALEGFYELRFEVWDTGIGIAPEKRDRLFESFSQADASLSRSYGGSGLGLAISKNLCRMMGGSLSAESELGKGSKFTFTVLCSATIEQAPPPRVHSPGKPFSVLLVEDSVLNQLVVSKMLEKLGHGVEVASSGEEALEKVQSGEYDIVLMDVSMPGMDGYETTRLLRQFEGAGPRHYIVALTAHALQGDRELCLAAGMDDYLTKPLTMLQLKNLLDRIEADI